MSDKEEIAKYRETMKKRESIGMGIAVGLLLIGVAFVFASVLHSGFATQVMNEDHLTDDGIAYRDMDNATYTWTTEELRDKLDDSVWLLAFGAGLAVSGYVMFIVVGILTPSKKKDHKRYCEVDAAILEKSKYCSECGLKLSLLEKD